ncbi:hypothetical protein [Nakamurella sp.]|uniref:hypothetical protein n=1 Tax=Nakamurella sp. TaxID=1869182 RepID=UPI003B3BA42A
MSLAGDRQAIADALSTATDVTGHLYRPVKLRHGDAWPLLGALERGPGRAFEVSWRVLVYLPQDGAAASEWVDAHHEGLVDALEAVGFVDRIEPITIPDGDANPYVLQITMRSE